MSHCSDLPPEILDLVIDFLYDEPETLRQCCLVSKSWVPRTRKHLFAVIEFHTKDKIEAWRKAFPDPSDSPARYTQSLKITCPRAITEADGIEGGWITTFSRLEHLQVKGSWTGASHLSSGLDLALFRNMPPTLKSLFVTSFPFPFLQFFNLIGSLPLLEDLSLVGDAPYINDDDPDQAHTAAPSSSPPFTGMLDLRLYRGIAGAANRLLNMPNGLRFRGLQLQWYRWEHLRYVVRLVAACSDTLELLDVTCMARGADSFCLNRHQL